MKLKTLVGAAGFSALLGTTSYAANLVGLWEFDDSSNLGKATVGTDLTVRGTAPSYHASITDGGGHTLTGVIKTTRGTGPGKVGHDLKVTNTVGANGGGNYTNQFSLIYDLMIPGDVLNTYYCLIQTSTGNANDADLVIYPMNHGRAGVLGSDATGYSSSRVAYPETWMRLVVSYNVGDAVAPFKAYLDGIEIAGDFTGSGIKVKDGRYALDSVFYLFGDDDAENGSLYVGSVAYFDGVITAEEARAFGKAGAPIPEPVTGLLMLGLGALGLRRRR